MEGAKINAVANLNQVFNKLKVIFKVQKDVLWLPLHSLSSFNQHLVLNFSASTKYEHLLEILHLKN